MSMHIDARPGDIASHVITAGDPDRVSYLAEHYLENAELVSSKRAALCYTGTYAGRWVSAMAVGMGIPSMLIYATELFRDYGCEAIVRVGTSAGYLDSMQRHDIVLSQAACHTSAINDGVFNGTFCPIADYRLLSTAEHAAAARKQKVYIGNTVCNDRLYRLAESYRSAAWRDYGILCSEMEGAALYTAAAQFGKRALMLVSILSHLDVDAEGKERIRPLPETPGKTMDDALILALETLAEDSRRMHGGL